MAGNQGDGELDPKHPLAPFDLPDGEPEMEIESLIIPAVEELHTSHIAAAAAKRKS